MRAELRILGQAFLLAVFTCAFVSRSLAADTILYATDFNNSRIWSVDITNGTNTLLTNTPGRADSLIFDGNGNILYGLIDLGELVSFNGTTNTVLVAGLGNPADLTL
jgi:outer membrane protein assembly factor BamB